MLLMCIWVDNKKKKKRFTSATAAHLLVLTISGHETAKQPMFQGQQLCKLVSHGLLRIN